MTTPLPPRGPAPVNAQMAAFQEKIGPALRDAIDMILVLQSQRRDPALITPMLTNVAAIVAISRKIFQPGGATKSAMTQIDALLAKLQKAQAAALAIIAPPSEGGDA